MSLNSNRVRNMILYLIILPSTLPIFEELYATGLAPPRLKSYKSWEIWPAIGVREVRATESVKVVCQVEVVNEGCVP